MLGDCYGAAVVEALSKKELIAMDEAAEKERNKELEGDIESGHETIVKKVKKVIIFSALHNIFLIYYMTKCIFTLPLQLFS